MLHYIMLHYIMHNLSKEFVVNCVRKKITPVFIFIFFPPPTREKIHFGMRECCLINYA